MGDKAPDKALLAAVRCLVALACGFALAVPACLLAAPSAAHAENAYFATDTYDKDLWSKYADTSWYDTDPNATSYSISTAAQLAGLAKLVVHEHVSFSGKTVNLVADVNIKAHQWFPIGCNEDNYWQNSPFEGTFDGHGHTISGLYIDNAWHHQALFGKVSDATLKNFSVKGSVTTGWTAAGVVAESYRSTLSNITNYAKVTTLFKSGDRGYSSTAGGVVAYVVDTYVKENGANASVLSNLRNYGEVECAGITEQGGGVGGIAGSLLTADDTQAIKVTQCENYGKVHALSSNYVDVYAKGAGGIVGSTATYGNYEISDCSNQGDVASDNLASTGGIVGSISGPNSSVSYCYNSGSVYGASPEAESSTGGIVGRSVSSHTGSTTLSVVSCYNTGSVSGRGSYVSAILGTTSGYGEDWDTTDAGTTVVNDSNYYVEGSAERSDKSGTLFQQGTVDAAQPVSASQMNSQEVVENLNATDDSMDHFAQGEVSPKLELKAGSDKGTDAASNKGDGSDVKTELSEDDSAHQKETHMYAVAADDGTDVISDTAMNLAVIALVAATLLIAAAAAAYQLGYYRCQRRRLKAVPSLRKG